MSSTNESTSSPTPAGMTVAQIAAIVLAVSVVSYLVWDAQAVADQDQLQPDRVVPAGLPEAAPPNSIPVDPNQVLLPSSKSRVINAPGSFVTVGSGVTLSGSKSGMLPSSKFLVLPSSKSGPPVLSDDEKPAVTAKPGPAQTVVPTQTGGRNKD